MNVNDILTHVDHTLLAQTSTWEQKNDEITKKREK